MDPYRNVQDDSQNDSKNDPEWIKQKFRKALVVQIALAVVVIGAALLFWIFQMHWGDRSFAPLIVFMIFAFGVLIVSLINWRCPACRKYLGRGFPPTYCPKCGVQLR